MAKRPRKKSDVYVILNSGEVFVQTPIADIYYRYARWLVKINPVLLFPGFRRSHKKIIYVNGKKYGRGVYKEGCIPLKSYLDEELYLSDKLVNFIKIHFGFCCRKSYRGYFSVRLGRYEYIVLRRYTKECNIFCQVYYKPTEELMGTFIIDSSFSKIYPQFTVDNWFTSMYAIIGYIADAVVYSTVASQLNRTLDVIY